MLQVRISLYTAGSGLFCVEGCILQKDTFVVKTQWQMITRRRYGRDNKEPEQNR